MADSQIEKIILNHLHQGDMDSAKSTLATWSPSEVSEKLQHLFCQAKVALYEGTYLKALEALQAYHHAHPQSLDALCDIALCLYQLGLQAELDLTLLKCQELFNLQTPRICSQKDLDHAIFLAKLYEEKARYHQAKEILLTPKAPDLTPWQEQSLRIQLLRIAVELRETGLARELYTQVITGTGHNLNFEIEREHALLLADSVLFGFAQARERFDYALTNNLSLADLNFLKGEMAEQAILNKQYDFLKTLDLQDNSESTYEREQAKLVDCHLRGEKNPPLSIIRLEKSLSPMSLLRLLRQALLLFADSSQSTSWAERYKFHCLNLPTRELQEIFLSSLYASTVAPSALQVNTQRKVIFLNGKELSVKSNLFWQLLKAFSKNQSETSIESAIATVYEEVPNEQHFDRLRIGIYRLNNTLEKTCHLKALFQITKNKVTLSIPTQEYTS
ncbi:hypothetical protein [Bdellovibrio svalbardensis]|uniref:Tetratricopeptide repeat protein n=1 Tax=Bdellovibrio svalbardensis TaxID=2972972 RepID=A0ABT6DQH4_9BACT|nr:hypothetical protein [Bdellovibrio svalbardensis]MDG0818164.1 hypothetical protein [Bdellovibrio svalbardensis]